MNINPRWNPLRKSDAFAFGLAFLHSKHIEDRGRSRSKETSVPPRDEQVRVAIQTFGLQHQNLEGKGLKFIQGMGSDWERARLTAFRFCSLTRAFRDIYAFASHFPWWIQRVLAHHPTNTNFSAFISLRTLSFGVSISSGETRAIAARA